MTTSRAQRTAQTRASLVDAALALFVRRGYRAVSLRDIAAEAGISHPALRKHFAGKEELLSHVLERFEEHTSVTLLPEVARGSTDELPFSAVARSNAAVPGYLPLFAGLVGEASAQAHPAHATMRDRAAEVRLLGAAMIEAAQAEGVVDETRDPVDESTRLMAAWDALQVIAQYLPDRVDIAATLERHEALLAFPVGWSEAEEPAADDDAGPAYTPLVEEPAVEAGYRSGRERRERILADAMTLFGREGYGDTALRDIAERVGVSKSALYHHFPSKDALLLAVLEERDRRIDQAVATTATASGADLVRTLPAGAVSNERDAPGLIEVYAVISCEAVPGGHPAHAYFAHRFASALEGFESMFRSAGLPAHRDPAHEALWLLALWDGLQYQWLYDRGSVDIGAQLRAHLDDVLPR